jgi:hypothetical protein
MKRTATAGAGLLVALTVGAVPAPAANATPSCVAQSIVTEHAAYGAAWGRDLIAFLATHPGFLQEFGFTSLGALLAYTAAQPPDACPPDL